ncbi:MAG TPA: SDR family oxidoreductase [Gemmatirosa sp.]
MDLGIRGRTALVFGGSKGLGRGCSDALAAEGVAVALVARGREALNRAAGEIAARHGVATYAFAADVADHDALLDAVGRAESALGGRIDVLVNNTGGPPPSGAAGVDPAVWTAQFQAMVLSVIRVTDRVLPGMRARGWGRVLTIASTTVLEPNPTLGMSNTLRSALVGWSKTLAGEVAREGVTVNMLLPGRVATDRTTFLDGAVAKRTGRSADEVHAENVRAIPVGRYGTPEEFGAVAAFLASERGGFVTGSMIRIDGGGTRGV